MKSATCNIQALKNNVGVDEEQSDRSPSCPVVVIIIFIPAIHLFVDGQPEK